MKPHELLDYAAKDPATWSKDEVRRLLREAATAITKQQQDAELAWRDMEIARLKRESVEWELIVEGALAALEDTPGGGYFSATASALRKTIAAAMEAAKREEGANG